MEGKEKQHSDQHGGKFLNSSLMKTHQKTSLIRFFWRKGESFVFLLMGDDCCPFSTNQFRVVLMLQNAEFHEKSWLINVEIAYFPEPLLTSVGYVVVCLRNQSTFPTLRGTSKV